MTDKEVDIILQQLRDMRYPGKVDVTEAVMAQVRQRPILAAPPHRHILPRVAASVAVLALGVAVLYQLRINSYEPSIDKLLSETYSYTANTVESAAIDDFSEDAALDLYLCE